MDAEHATAPERVEPRPVTVEWADAQPGPPAGGVAADAQPRPAVWQRVRRLLPRSLTARLVSGVVALVIVIVLATGIGTYFALRSFLYDRLDQQVAQVADSNQNAVEHARCIGQGAVVNCYPPNGTLRSPVAEWFAVLDPSGVPLRLLNGQSPDFRAMQLSAEQRAALMASPSPSRTLTTIDGAELRVQGRAIVTPAGNYVVVTGLSTDNVDHTLGRLLVLEVIIGASAVIVALVATAYGVRFSLRRLRRVSGTAREVAAELSPEGTGLERRVPVDEPGTEVGQLADSMNTLLAAVETQFAARLASERRMRQFLADASHELRTPLTSIRGFAELARMQRARGGRDEDNLARIEAEGTRMSRLVDDLLTLARGDQGGSTPHLEIVEVRRLLGEAISGARAAYPQRSIRLDPTHDLSVLGDPDQLMRVVRNLINNAAVHTRPDGAITLRAFPDSGQIAIQVSDEGPGLPPEEAAQVFERFWRADKARSRAHGGTGLGLAIVASVVAAHHGSVRFDSDIERGSTVTVWLPDGDNPAEAGRAESTV